MFKWQIYLFTYLLTFIALILACYTITIVVYSTLDCSIRMSSDSTESLNLEAIRASQESKESSAVHMNTTACNYEHLIDLY